MSLDFVAMDVETANASRGSICSIGLSEVSNGQVVSRTNLLTQLPGGSTYFDPFNVQLHGITAQKVAGEPPFRSRLAQAMEIVDGRPVMFHNAAFDTGAIREACDFEGVDWVEMTYGCSLVIGRRTIPMLSYRLPFMCEELGIPHDNHHDAGADAEACARITIELARRQEVNTLEDLAASARVRLGVIDPVMWRGCRRERTGSGDDAPPTANPDADPSHPLYGQTMVFTGALGMYTRADAWDAVAKVGAIPEKGVNKRTTMLVVGDGFQGSSLEEFSTSKAKKALDWQKKGHTIEVLTAEEFFALLDEGAEGRKI